MSIKSQKTLNDECSEIFEKSYSVRSASEESLSCDEEDTLVRDVLKKLTPAALSRLKKRFKRSSKRGADSDKRVEDVMRAAAAEEGIEFPPRQTTAVDELCLDARGFADAVHETIGNRKYSVHVQKLIQVLDPFGRGRVTWRRLVSRLEEAGARATGARIDRWTPAKEARVAQLKHCKRETIVQVVSIEREESFCYVIVSRGGRVGVYSGNLQVLNTYEIFYDGGGVKRRIRNRWITDAVYMEDVQCLVFSASDRSLVFYDATSLSHAPLYSITGLPNIPTCLAYSPASSGGSTSDLIFGTERGDITRLQFWRPRVSLLPVRSPDHISSYFWMELSSPPLSSYCSTATWRAHSRTVRRVTCERVDMVLSCSHDAHSSLRMRRTSLLPDYVYAVPRGITCFHLVMSLQLLATGSPDGVVRLWGTTGGESYARLQASAAVHDVVVVPDSEIVVAFCNDASVHIWDVFEECLLQIIKIKFPFLGVLGKKVEFGTYCMHPGPPHDPPDDPLDKDYTEEQKKINSSRCEILIWCCDTVCVLAFRPPTGSVRAPPGDTLRAKRPSYWELPGEFLNCERSIGTRDTHRQSRTELIQTTCAPTAPPAQLPQMSPPSTQLVPEDQSVPQLEELLKNAGLQGILEKDFALMKGLKHDLNRKIHELGASAEAMRCLVGMGTPYLALTTAQLEPLPDFERLASLTERVVRSHAAIVDVVPTPTLASTVTPTPSERRRRQSFRP